MRVLTVDLEPSWRGGQEQASLLLKGLRARGHEAELVALRGGPLARHAAAAQIPVHTVTQKMRRLSAAWLIRSLLSGRGLRRQGPGERASGIQGFDIVHVNEPHALFSAWLARAHRHAAMVIARRVAFPVPRNRISLIRYRAAARIVAVSNVVRNDLLAARLDPPGVDVVPDGVDLPPLLSSDERRRARLRWNLPPDSQVLSFVASLTEEKGHALLLEAFAALRHHAGSHNTFNPQASRFRLLLAGDGPLRASLEQKAREAGVTDAVTFAGFVEDVRAIHAASDLFIFPSLSEGSGSALLSAMACGLPVVALARGGVNEIVEDGQNGLLVENAVADPIARAALRLLSDGELAQKLATGGRQTITAHFSSDHMVENTLRVFEHLAGRRSRSAEMIPA